jgi:hypothetical protein
LLARTPSAGLFSSQGIRRRHALKDPATIAAQHPLGIQARTANTMLYTLAGAAKATGLGTAVILAAIEEGRIGADRDLFGEWHIEGGELHRLYPPIAASVSGADTSHTSPATSATNLEAEIATVIRTAADELRQTGGGEYCELEPSPSDLSPPRPTNDTDTNDTDTNDTDLGSARPLSGCEIKIGDRDKVLGFTLPARSEYSRIAALAATLSLTFGIGWIAGLSSHQLLWGSAAAERNRITPARISAAENQIPARIRSNRAYPQGARTRKIRTAAGAANGPGQETTQSIGPAASTNRTAATAVQNALNRRGSPSLRTVPETRPTTIEGWIVRDVAEGIAILEGPDGTWKAARGDTVPGLGKIDSIVLWGNRWIVATSRGLITTE